MPSNLYENDAISFICGRNFKFAGVDYEVMDEFDQELHPGRIEQLVRTRYIYPVVDSREDKTRFFHREIHVREDIERILGKARGKGQIILERPEQPEVEKGAPEPEPQDVAEELASQAEENVYTEQVLEEENATPNEDDIEEGETEPGQTEPLPLVHPAEIEEEDVEEPEVIEEELYDPSKHNVDEVLEYLTGDISDAEYHRVLAAEKNGKQRKGILGDS